MRLNLALPTIKSGTIVTGLSMKAHKDWSDWTMSLKLRANTAFASF